MLIYLTMIEAEEDRHRFLSLYRRYKKLMLYIAHDILHDPHDAEDAVHEAFLRLAEMIEGRRRTTPGRGCGAGGRGGPGHCGPAPA